MKKVNIITYAHNLLLKYLNKDMIIVDATCGNGHDTLFLAKHVKHVHAIDIQLEAIHQTKALTNDFTNITFHHKSHEHLNDYIDTYDGVIFNLGYLPGSDKTITTKHTTTIQALVSIHQRHKGFVLIVAYPGHNEGFIEQVAIVSFLDKLDIKYEVIRLPHITQKEAPIIYFYKYN